jgi:hypothetical protein
MREADNTWLLALEKREKSIQVITNREMDIVARKEYECDHWRKGVINLSQSDHNLSESSVTAFCVGIFFSHIGRIM